jgi:hypothetical protein
MSKISITQRCNRRCPYCFAVATMKSSSPSQAFMTAAEFEQALDFLSRSNVPEATLLGGEPCLHPSFCEFVERALVRGFRVLVFSGGIIPEEALRYLEAAAREQIALMLNVARPDDPRNSHERLQQTQVMRRLGPKVALGLNIERVNTPLEFLLDLINAYGLHRTVRVGIAHPAVGGHNAFLHPRDYLAVGRRVSDFALCAARDSVRLEFDCGWVPCAFPKGVLEQLDGPAGQVGLRCNPILDVLPGNQAIACYPLASLLREPLPAEQDSAWLSARIEDRLAPYRALTLFRRCATCGWRARGECSGGCLASRMRRLRTAEAMTPVQ